MSTTLLSVVVPVYNEQEVISETCKRLKGVLDGMDTDYEIVFVNDGSRDGTLEFLRPFCRSNPQFKLVSFSRNFGHQTAVTAGLDRAKGDAVVIIDADLQDPPEVIPGMFEVWKQGYEVVYGKRLSRKGESFFKKFTAKAFYRVLSAMSEVKLPVDTGDFRLIDRRVVEAMRSMPEHNRYLRGIGSWLGFKQYAFEYERHERFAGTTKYPLKKMLKLAEDAIISFSAKPLKLAGTAGGVICLLSFIYLLWSLIALLCGITFLTSQTAVIIAAILFSNGAIMIFIGILGKYVGRIYDEAKARPLYIVSDTVNID